MGQIDLNNHTIQKNINTKQKQVLGNWKMNVIALTMAICALFVMNLEISFAELKEREVGMMGIGEAPALRSIEREEPATRSDEPGEGGVEGKKMLTLVELICRIPAYGR